MPHNFYICYRYNVHVNFQAVQSIKSSKYIFKYITKRHDKTNATIVDENNEVKRQF
jgi:hypothetical protein